MPIVTPYEVLESPPSIGENPASMGHNMPPVEEIIAMEFREALLGDRPDFLSRLDAAIAAVDRVVITDDESLGKAGDLDKILRASEAYVADKHKIVKEPYLARGRAVDAEKNGLTGRITPARYRLRDMMNEHMAKIEAARRAEAARIAAEQRAAAEAAAAAEAEQRRAEQEAARAAEEAERARMAGDAEAAAAARIAQQEAETAAREAERRMEQQTIAAAVSAPKNEPIRSDAGATVSGRKEWQSEVTDYEVAFMAVSDDEKVREAIDKAVARRVKAGARKIEGVRIWEAIKAMAR